MEDAGVVEGFGRQGSGHRGGGGAETDEFDGAAGWGRRAVEACVFCGEGGGAIGGGRDGDGEGGILTGEAELGEAVGGAGGGETGERFGAEVGKDFIR